MDEECIDLRGISREEMIERLVESKGWDVPSAWVQIKIPDDKSIRDIFTLWIIEEVIRRRESRLGKVESDA